MNCIICDKPAQWVRSTQFAGEHPFCEEHATKESDFKENDSYQFWYKLEGEQDANQGKTTTPHQSSTGEA